VKSYNALLIAKLVSAASTMEGLSQSEILDPLPGEGVGDKLKGLLVALSELGGVERHMQIALGVASKDPNGGTGTTAEEDSMVLGVMDELRAVMREVEEGS
jgi:hypothetical protein